MCMRTEDCVCKSEEARSIFLDDILYTDAVDNKACQLAVAPNTTMIFSRDTTTIITFGR